MNVLEELMSLKDTLKSLSRQGKIAGTFAMGAMSADGASNMDVEHIQQAAEAIVKKISEPRVKRTTSEAMLEEILKTPTQPVSATMRVLTDKELWTPDFQEGMDNLVHEFLQASPRQIQKCQTKLITQIISLLPVPILSFLLCHYKNSSYHQSL